MSQRQYTNETRVRELANENTLLVPETILCQAEELIDLYCADFILPSLKAPFYNVESILEANFTTESDIVNLSSTEDLETNYLKYCNIQILESDTESEVGQIFPVINSANLTIKISTDSLTAGTKTIKLFQMGKFPRVCDVELSNNYYYKVIPVNVSQACTYQAMFMVQQPELFDGSESVGLLASESISANGAYSYSTGNGDNVRALSNAMLERMIAPQAKQLLVKYKVQTLL